MLRSDAAGRTGGFIPDGSLCSGGNPTFAAYDMARTDWPLTHLTPGAVFVQVQQLGPPPGHVLLLRHPRRLEPTRPLAWADLEARRS